MKRKILATGLALAAAVSFVACGGERVQEEGDQEEARMEQAREETVAKENKKELPPGGTIGVFLPEKAGAGWREDARILREELIREGYGVSLYFAKDAGEQSRQMENALQEELRGMLIAPAGKGSLEEGLQKAENQKIPVVSYGTLIRDTETVDAYVTYDYQEAGRLWGEFLVQEWEAAGEKSREEPPEFGEKEELWRNGLVILKGESREAQIQVSYAGLEESVNASFPEGMAEEGEGRIRFPGTDLPDGGEEWILEWEELLSALVARRQPEELARKGAEVMDLCARDQDADKDAALVYDNGAMVVPAHPVPLPGEEALFREILKVQWTERADSPRRAGP